MFKSIRKAVFPVAGLGSRFLPATKANPKEMLPIVDKPLIQFAVEEAMAAGIQQLIFVTSSSKRSIEDHFDINTELEHHLALRGDNELLQIVHNILPEGMHCIYVRQSEPRGLGHAVLCAKEVIGDEPFAVLLADDLIQNAGRGCLAQLMEIYANKGGNVIAVEKINPLDSDKYGIISGLPIEQNLTKIEYIVEKPHPEDALSDLAVAGRYILQPEIFSLLHTIKPGRGNEVQLTDAISQLLHQQEVYGLQFSGQRYDCGNKLGYVKATLEYALQHPEIASDFEVYLKELLKMPGLKTTKRA